MLASRLFGSNCFITRKSDLHVHFTIVTPNYNMGRYLEETIESVLANLAPGDEYFIIDGGSDDCSLDVIRRYEGRISGWISERDHGYADALAKGFARSNADCQCWINCGDLLLPGTLEQARASLKETGADMIFGDDFYVDESGRLLQVSDGAVDDLRNMMLYGGWTPLQDACFWKRSLYEKVGGLNAGVRYAADFDLFLRMSLAGTCTYVPKVFSAFRRHDGQTSRLHELAYRKESLAIRTHLANNNSCAVSRVGLSAYYWFAVRWKARLCSRYANVSPHLGRPVKEFRCTPTQQLLAA
jgi:glycosyltransferase involved in cell wall biosynthesis